MGFRTEREVREDETDVLEMMRCAEVNFSNFANAFPGAANHPFFKVSMKQLKMAIEAMEAKEK